MADPLAIHGGKAVREKLLPYGRQSVDEEDILAVGEVLRSDWLTTGPKVDEFEEAFAGYVGTRHAVSFSSGTAALHGAVFAADLGPGDEAVTTPITFCATANCLLYQGASPVFADVSPDTLNLDPDGLTRRITPRTRAILPVDYAGHPADLGPIMELAGRHGLTVIEDGCHALGAELGGRRVGRLSHMTVFSFHPVKHLTTGEGGMVATDDERFARRLRLFRNHGIDSDARDRQSRGEWFYEMVDLGWNYRLTDIGCALGLVQLRKLDRNLARRREIAAAYTEAFRKMEGMAPPAVRPGANPAWHLYPVRIEPDKLAVGRREIFRALRAEGLGVNVHYIPVHLHPYYRDKRGHRKGECPVAEDAYERLISLPIFHGMTDQDAEDVVHAMGKVMEHYVR
ncbi:MAG: UDP-4-amino-4,6-dideoxy-N-acetyl-beta-L-altrosamine transaminase [Candidatus Tectomicrobia bacterium]|uniref:UDP-4-amino-4, 6-dideoxy-N-acetyl-beta-L-altrosamine transaminase n=1 Tax=Tectimicrobiota bacterium TaxID=2528274 RepID=A0A932HXI7_UNCTE|nr:UDP-4-amino-4,6-dideoxy-N-acetyl-beta-L-altrosamine transaminase [Candidatus Tectomicrobia bacterium]